MTLTRASSLSPHSASKSAVLNFSVYAFSDPVRAALSGAPPGTGTRMSSTTSASAPGRPVRWATTSAAISDGFPRQPLRIHRHASEESLRPYRAGCAGVRERLISRGRVRKGNSTTLSPCHLASMISTDSPWRIPRTVHPGFRSSSLVTAPTRRSWCEGRRRKPPGDQAGIPRARTAAAAERKHVSTERKAPLAVAAGRRHRSERAGGIADGTSPAPILADVCPLLR